MGLQRVGESDMICWLNDKRDGIFERESGLKEWGYSPYDGISALNIALLPTTTTTKKRSFSSPQYSTNSVNHQIFILSLKYLLKWSLLCLHYHQLKSLVFIGGQSGCHHFSPITATAYFLDFWHPQWLFFGSPPTLSPAVTVIFWKHKFDHVSLLLKILGFHGGSVVKNLPGNAGDTDSNPGLEKSPGAGNGNPLPYSCWEIPCTEEPGRLQSPGLQLSN